MSPNNKNNSIMVPPPATSCTPYVLLTKLTTEDITRLTGTNRDEQSSLNSHIQTVQIKQEYPYGHQENFYDDHYEVQNMGWREECSTVVKIETTTTTRIKTELPDDYPVFNPPYTPCTDLIASMPNYKCDQCQDEFIAYEAFIIHKSFMHDNKPYVCGMCDARFSLSAHLNVHTSEHINNSYSSSGGSTLPTNIQSSSRSNLAINYNNHNSIPFSQDSFNTGTKSEQNKKKFKKTNMSVVSTQKYSASSINKLLLNSKICQPFKCPDCLFSSASEMEFTDHLKDCNNRFVPENKQFHCLVCTKTFINQAALNAHMKYHVRRGEFISKRKLNGIVKSQNDIPSKKSPTLIGHKCKECNRNFISRRKLHIHLLQHKKQMMCKLCHKQYFLEKAFKKHMITHEDITVAGYKKNGSNTFNENRKVSSGKSTKHKSFPTKANTDDEKQLKHGLKNKNQNSIIKQKRLYAIAMVNVKPKLQRLQAIKCNWCSAFITRCNLIRHINNFHPNVKPLKCSHCPKKFKNHASMKLHVNDSHKN